jgi:hypothetical protein
MKVTKRCAVLLRRRLAEPRAPLLRGTTPGDHGRDHGVSRNYTIGAPRIDLLRDVRAPRRGATAIGPKDRNV